MSKHFISFADQRMRQSGLRIKKQATKLNIFDHVRIYNETDLNQQFINHYNDKLIPRSKGFGYWVWKAEIISQQLDEMNYGDMLLYMDAGSHIRTKGTYRLSQYFDFAKKSSAGIFLFDSSYPEELNMGFHTARDKWQPHYHPCYKHIKADLLGYFAKLTNTDLLNSPMCESGHIFIVKTLQSVLLINEWRMIPWHSFNLIDDSVSAIPNLEGFEEHRHDQSILTLLARKYQAITISNAETYYPSIFNQNISDWKIIDNFPIHARRDRDYGLIANFIHRLKLFFKLKIQMRIYSINQFLRQR